MIKNLLDDHGHCLVNKLDEQLEGRKGRVGERPRKEDCSPPRPNCDRKHVQFLKWSDGMQNEKALLDEHNSSSIAATF